MAQEILIVDDEPDIRMLIDGVLQDEGYAVRQAGDSDQAVAAFRHRRPSMVILDVWLQGSKLDGLGILQAMHTEEPHVPVVMISGHGTIETAVTAIQHGAYDFIEKPFKSDRLLLIVRRALEAARLSRENAELRLRAGVDSDLTGQSGAIAGLRAAVERVAPTGSRVLITGPAGSGKEVVARMIHQRSRRADGPFVVLNCATLAPARFEEELFGVEAGGGSGHRAAAGGGAGAGAWRDAAVGRGVGHAVGDAGQDRPCAPGPDVRADRRVAPGEGGCTGAGDHQPGLAGRDCGRGGSGRICSTGWPWCR